MDKHKWIEASTIMDELSKLRKMEGKKFYCHVVIDNVGTTMEIGKLTSIVYAAFERARLERIIHLEKQFDEL